MEDKNIIKDKLFINDKDQVGDDLLINNSANSTINNNKNWVRRTFGKLTPGSLRSAIFNLSILSVGVGVLAIPSRFSFVGLIPCLLIIMLIGIGSYITLRILLDKAIDNKVNQFSALVNKILGRKLEVFFDVVVMIHLFGSCIMYQIISKYTI